jgi:hypothetical protein
VITKERMLRYPDNKVDRLARAYQEEAKSLGKEKVKSWRENEQDFKIIALATLCDLDIVFSNDKRTMLAYFNQEACKIINLRKGLRTPTFYDYIALKKSFVR